MFNSTSERLRQSIPEILNLWERRALSEIDSAHTQGSLALRDSLPEYLEQLCKSLSTTIDRTAARMRFDKEESLRIGKIHGKSRAKSPEYTMNDLIKEYHILRQVVCDHLERTGVLSAIEREVIVCSVEQAVSYAATEFSFTLNTQTTELKHANQELYAFSYSVSHDLRAPLRSMDGFSQLLLDNYADKLDEKAMDYLHRIRSSSQKMAKLIDDLLLLSRIGRKEVQRETVDLTYLTQHIFNRLRATQPERKISIAVDPVCLAQADQGLIRIVLENLLSNAFKYSSKLPETKISFSCRQSETNVHETVYYVKDHGVGFEMKYAEQLFKPFHRLHSVKDYPGSGIGLATVKNIVERHGGKIWAESSPIAGTTFAFTLGETGVDLDTN